jgi:hypothetical protein
MQLYAGLDLHSRNTYIGIMDREFKLARICYYIMRDQVPFRKELLAQ